jgi:hypothetical protein
VISFTARWASLMAAFVVADAAESEFAIWMLPNGCLPITQGFSSSAKSSPHRSLFDYA